MAEMITKNDVREIVQEVVAANNIDFKQELAATEQRLLGEVHALEGKIADIVHKEMGEVIEDNLMPVLDHLLDRANKTEGRLSTLEDDLASIKSQMVTKDYFDDKIEVFEMKLVGPMRRQDQKVNQLVGTLHKKSVLSNQEAQAIQSIEVFPQA